MKRRMHTRENEKAIKTAAPPNSGVGILCVLISVGLSISPVFIAIARKNGVRANETANARIKLAAYKRKFVSPISAKTVSVH